MCHTPTRAHHFTVDSPFFDIFKEACLARWVHFLRLPVSRNTRFFIIVILEVEERSQTSANINKTFLKFIFEYTGWYN